MLFVKNFCVKKSLQKPFLSKTWRILVRGCGLDKKLLTSALLIILIGGFALAGIPHTVQAATNVTGIIYSDATWTKANSPYTLTGPVAVNVGVTLTIEPGASVELNGYYIQVNGTLIARGTAAEEIRFSNGQIKFTDVSVEWNEQTGSGCIIEQAILDKTSLYSSNSLKISGSSINENYSDSVQLFLGGSSVLTDNVIKGAVEVEGAALISGNTITGRVTAGDSSTIMNNLITQDEITFRTTNKAYAIRAGIGSTISGNTVTGVANPAYPVPTGELAAICGYDNSVISNNEVTGTIGGQPSVISNNIITGGGFNSDWGGQKTSAIYAIDIYSNSSTISDNSITGTTGAAINFNHGSSTISDNTIIGDIRGGSDSTQTTIAHNTIEGRIGVFQGHLAIFDNVIRNGALNCGGSEVSIHDNVIYYCENGIGVFEGTATIERNVIVKNGIGISIEDQAVIRGNTISENNIGIELNNAQSVTIEYNNIQNSTQNSVYLATSSNIEASNNWWGTTDTQEISNSIFDFEEDFNLGKVNFVPFLTEPNPDAPEIPPLTTSPTPSPTSTPTTTPSPTTSPTSTPTSTPESLPTDFTTIAGAAIVAIITGAGLGLLIYLIKRK
jgi:hypothetical protein